jgi:hypothetical protein
MDSCMITFRSVTPAQRGETLLRREGIAATVQRTPRSLAEQGCGYSLRLNYGQLQRATEILRQKGIAYRKTYHIREGNPVEVSI